MLRILTPIIEEKLQISVTRLFKSFMGVRIMVYEEDIWNFMYVSIFRKFLYSNLVYATEASIAVHFLSLMKYLKNKQPKGRRDSFWFTVSKT